MMSWYIFLFSLSCLGFLGFVNLSWKILSFSHNIFNIVFALFLTLAFISKPTIKQMPCLFNISSFLYYNFFVSLFYIVVYSDLVSCSIILSSMSKLQLHSFNHFLIHYYVFLFKSILLLPPSLFLPQISGFAFLYSLTWWV